MSEDFPFHVEPLSEQDRAAFSCGNELLDKYFHTQVSQDVRKNATACFVLVEDSTSRVAGFYTLASTSIIPSVVPLELAKKFPKYPHLPATLLGRLAVDLTFRGRRIGEFLLMDALLNCAVTAESVGSIAIIVDAKDENAANFYKHFEFVPLIGQPQRLFLPMKTAKSLFEPS
jgi:GNAT superfamily N-acetyltransferase